MLLVLKVNELLYACLCKSILSFVWTYTATASVCKDGDVRLTEGRHYRQGKVEVCRNQHWGRVCDDEWDKNESTVVCRQLQLGLSSTQGITDIVDGEEKAENLPFVLDDLGCTGSENNLLECLPQHNCVTSVPEFVEVSCTRQKRYFYYCLCATQTNFSLNVKVSHWNGVPTSWRTTL